MTDTELLSKVVDEARTSSGDFFSISEDRSCNHGGQQRAAVEFSQGEIQRGRGEIQSGRGPFFEL
jgi:hypothetical protein